jgi:hypothetical protein
LRVNQTLSTPLSSASKVIFFIREGDKTTGHIPSQISQRWEDIKQTGKVVISGLAYAIIPVNIVLQIFL